MKEQDKAIFEEEHQQIMKELSGEMQLKTNFNDKEHNRHYEIIWFNLFEGEEGNIDANGNKSDNEEAKPTTFEDALIIFNKAIASGQYNNYQDSIFVNLSLIGDDRKEPFYEKVLEYFAL